MEWESKLLAVPADQWIVNQMIALDWYDGPRSGICVLANPAADFIFEFVDEEHNSDGSDLRIFRLRELPPGSVASFTSDLESIWQNPEKLGKPNQSWDFVQSHEGWMPE